LQSTQVLLYDKIVRKIFFLLFALLPLFLLAIVPKPALAISSGTIPQYDCSQRPPTSCSVQDYPNCAPYSPENGDTCSGCSFSNIATGTQYCAVKSTTEGAGSQSTASIPIGKTGCSYKNDNSQTGIILCQDGGLCIGGDYNSSTDSYEDGYCQSEGCPVCDQGYEYDRIQNDCQNTSGAHDHKPLTSVQNCTGSQTCISGCGCDINKCAGQAWPTPPPLAICSQSVCQTALGNIPTSVQALITTVFSIALSIAGIVALGLIIFSGYRLMISQGNPEQVKNAREQLTAAIIGLLFIIFSLVILRIIGFNILNIPGFG
jgi:hypothetical protein